MSESNTSTSDAMRSLAATAASDAFAEAGASASASSSHDDPIARIAGLLADLLRDSIDEAAHRAVQLAQLQSALGDDQVISRDAAATLLSVHPKTLERYERDGTLPKAGRLGGTPVYTLGVIRAISRAAAAGRDTRAAAADAATATSRGGRPGRGGRQR